MKLTGLYNILLSKMGDKKNVGFAFEKSSFSNFETALPVTKENTNRIMGT